MPTILLAWELGAGLIAPIDDAEALLSSLDTLLHNDAYTKAATAFAHRYQGFQPSGQLREVLLWLEAQLPTGDNL